jgi:hypothetical protein
MFRWDIGWLEGLRRNCRRLSGVGFSAFEPSVQESRTNDRTEHSRAASHSARSDYPNAREVPGIGISPVGGEGQPSA